MIAESKEISVENSHSLFYQKSRTLILTQLSPPLVYRIIEMKILNEGISENCSKKQGFASTLFIR